MESNEITKEGMFSDLKNFVMKNDRLPDKTELLEMYPETIIKEYFKSCSSLINRLKFDYTKTELIEILKYKYKQLHRNPYRLELKIPMPLIYIKQFGSLSEAFEQAGLDEYDDILESKIFERGGKVINEDDLLEEVRNYYEITNRVPNKLNFDKDIASLLMYRFKNWTTVLNKALNLNLKVKHTGKSAGVSYRSKLDITNIARKDGVLTELTKEKFRELIFNEDMTLQDIADLYNVYTHKVINQKHKQKDYIGQTPYSDEELIQLLKNNYKKLNRIPQKNEQKHPSVATYANRFGSWEKALEKANLINSEQNNC